MAQKRTLYHGSHEPNLTTLRPNTDSKSRRNPAVYFSDEVYGPEMYAVLKHSPHWMNIDYVTSKDKFKRGAVWGEGGPAEFHDKGYIYTATSTKGIRKNPRADNNELISRDPVEVAFYKEVSKHDVLGRGWIANPSKAWQTRKNRYGPTGRKRGN